MDDSSNTSAHDLSINSYATTESKVQTDTWFDIERRGKLKRSRFTLLASLSNSILKLKVSQLAPKPKYLINFELIPIHVEILPSRIVLTPQGSRSTFTIEHHDTAMLDEWGFALRLVAEASHSHAKGSTHISKFRWWKVRDM